MGEMSITIPGRDPVTVSIDETDGNGNLLSSAEANQAFTDGGLNELLAPPNALNLDEVTITYGNSTYTGQDVFKIAAGLIKDSKENTTPKKKIIPKKSPPKKKGGSEDQIMLLAKGEVQYGRLWKPFSILWG